MTAEDRGVGMQFPFTTVLVRSGSSFAVDWPFGKFPSISGCGRVVVLLGGSLRG